MLPIERPKLLAGQLPDPLCQDIAAAISKLEGQLPAHGQELGESTKAFVVAACLNGISIEKDLHRAELLNCHLRSIIDHAVRSLSQADLKLARAGAIEGVAAVLQAFMGVNEAVHNLFLRERAPYREDQAVGKRLIALTREISNRFSNAVRLLSLADPEKCVVALQQIAAQLESDSDNAGSERLERYADLAESFKEQDRSTALLAACCIAEKLGSIALSSWKGKKEQSFCLITELAALVQRAEKKAPDQFTPTKVSQTSLAFSRYLRRWMEDDPSSAVKVIRTHQTIPDISDGASLPRGVIAE